MVREISSLPLSRLSLLTILYGKGGRAMLQYIRKVLHFTPRFAYYFICRPAC